MARKLLGGECGTPEERVSSGLGRAINEDPCTRMRLRRWKNEMSFPFQENEETLEIHSMRAYRGGNELPIGRRLADYICTNTP